MGGCLYYEMDRMHIWSKKLDDLHICCSVRFHSSHFWVMTELSKMLMKFFDMKKYEFMTIKQRRLIYRSLSGLAIRLRE